ncbi:conserved Plasmodium protein, unknown function [Plasmodium ovale]|uniref:WD repeat-containing protein n=1 Tax=Plasmodium ovale TaxID=36330 RepID=A0A1C3KM72_PLAOA|nr:conserved Plasmodium protein, unknown function [Plasmodium ovale]
MDICISHLYNRQINKNILQDVFYKLENFDNEEFLCFDVNASGSLLVAATKTSIYFFNILTGTLLIQFNYYNEKKKEERLKKDIYAEASVKEHNDNNRNEDGHNELGGTGNGLRNDTINEKEEKEYLKKSKCYSENDILNSYEIPKSNPNCNDIGDAISKESENQGEDAEIVNQEERRCSTSTTVDYEANEHTEKLLPENNSPPNDDSVKLCNKRKHILLKGQKAKKVKKRSRNSQKGVNRNVENANNAKGKNNEGSGKKTMEDKLEDENIYIKKLQFIKNDEYLLCISKRYLYIYKICNYPITRIIYIDMLYLCIGIETIISDKLFFPCFFSEYFYFLYKENEHKHLGGFVNNSSSGDITHMVTSYLDVGMDINKCKENVDLCKEKYIDAEIARTFSRDTIGGGEGHLKFFEDYYKLYTSLSMKKIRNFEMCEAKCIHFKKKNYFDNFEKRTMYIIDLILCLKEQIPYVSRIYIGKKGKRNKEPNDEWMNNYVIDIIQTFPLISLEHMNITFQESTRESCLNSRRDLLYTKSRTKVKKKYLKGFLKNLVHNQGGVANQKGGKEAGVCPVVITQAGGIPGEVVPLGDNATILETQGDGTKSGNCQTKGMKKDEECIGVPKYEHNNQLEQKGEENLHLIKFYENYENNRKYLKKLLNASFPVCLYKNICKRRSKELPTTLNVYDNLDDILKEDIHRGGGDLDQEGEEKVKERGKFEKVEKPFRWEKGYYLFDYSDNVKNDYLIYPSDLIKNKNTFKNINKYSNVDKHKHYVFVGTHSYILAYELHYIKNCAVKEGNEIQKMNILRNNKVYKKIEEISDKVHTIYDNFIKNVERNIHEKKLELKFLFKIYLGIVTPLEIVIREKGNILCVRTLEKVFLYKVNYKYCVEGLLWNENEDISHKKLAEKCKNEGGASQMVNNSINNVADIKTSMSERGNKETEKKSNVYSYIDQICLYHTIHNPIQKEIHELCYFSEDIYQSYLLIVSLKSGIYTLYIYDLKRMDLQNAVKVNISAYKGFKQIKWIKCYDMLIALSNVGSYILVLKNKHLNNWSFFISDFELIDSNIEVIEEDNEFDIIENVEPKHKNLDDSIWKYILIYLNIFVKNKICIQSIVHPSSFFPTLYTGYYKNSPKYFFYESFYDFTKENFVSFEPDEFTAKKKWGKETENRGNLFRQIWENLDYYMGLKLEEMCAIKESEETKDNAGENTNDLLIKDNSDRVELLAYSPVYYMYYKNIINYSI